MTATMWMLWMLQGSYNTARPRSQVAHLSLGDDHLLCGRHLAHSEYECVDEIGREDIEAGITFSFSCGTYVFYYNICRLCRSRWLRGRQSP